MDIQEMVNNITMVIVTIRAITAGEIIHNIKTNDTNNMTGVIIVTSINMNLGGARSIPTIDMKL